jgi:hypothetical protein
MPSSLFKDAQEIDEVLTLLSDFQDLFGNSLVKYQLKKKMENNQIYLVAEV